MRTVAALCLLTAGVLAVGGCGKQGHTQAAHRVLAAPVPVRCGMASGVAAAPGPPLVFGAVGVPPPRLSRAVAAGPGPWAYFRKYGITIRAHTPAVLISVPPAWRHSVAIAWGADVGAASSLRFVSCPPQPGLGQWNSYAGGFWLHAPTGCVPLVIAVAGKTVTVRFAIGRSCGTAT